MTPPYIFIKGHSDILKLIHRQKFPFFLKLVK